SMSFLLLSFLVFSPRGTSLWLWKLSSMKSFFGAEEMFALASRHDAHQYSRRARWRDRHGRGSLGFSRAETSRLVVAPRHPLRHREQFHTSHRISRRALLTPHRRRARSGARAKETSRERSRAQALGLLSSVHRAEKILGARARRALRREARRKR